MKLSKIKSEREVKTICTGVLLHAKEKIIETIINFYCYFLLST